MNSFLESSEINRKINSMQQPLQDNMEKIREIAENNSDEMIQSLMNETNLLFECSKCFLVFYKAKTFWHHRKNCANLNAQQEPEGKQIEKLSAWEQLQRVCSDILSKISLEQSHQSDLIQSELESHEKDASKRIILSGHETFLATSHAVQFPNFEFHSNTRNKCNSSEEKLLINAAVQVPDMCLDLTPPNKVRHKLCNCSGLRMKKSYLEPVKFNCDTHKVVKTLNKSYQSLFVTPKPKTKVAPIRLQKVSSPNIYRIRQQDGRIKRKQTTNCQLSASERRNVISFNVLMED